MSDQPLSFLFQVKAASEVPVEAGNSMASIGSLSTICKARIPCSLDSGKSRIWYNIGIPHPTFLFMWILSRIGERAVICLPISDHPKA